MLCCKNDLISMTLYVGGKINLCLGLDPLHPVVPGLDGMDANLDSIVLVGMALSGFVLVTITTMLALWGFRLGFCINTL